MDNDIAIREDSTESISEPIHSTLVNNNVESTLHIAQHQEDLTKDSTQSEKSKTIPITTDKVPQPTTVGPENFEKIRILGAGSTGRVYLVRSVGLPKTEYYAMKVVKKSELIRRNRLQRIMAERQILTKANHPFIVTLHYCFQTPDFFYLVMQYCAGGEFYAILRKQPHCRVSEEVARFYAAEVLVALEYLHMIGIIYRDLKPENILVHESGHVMLGDFDLAHELKSFSSSGARQSHSQRRCSTSALKRTSVAMSPPLSPTISTSDRALGSRLRERRIVNITEISTDTMRKHENTRGRRSSCPCLYFPVHKSSYPVIDTESHLDSGEQRTSFVGTHEYVAPEIIAEEAYNRSVDWWAFGILIYEMVYGRTPFRGKNQIQTLENILDISEDIDFPLDVPVSENCKDLIQQLLAKTVDKRLQNPLFIKSHPFFEGIVWPLIRHQTAPMIPSMVHHHDEREYTVEEMESFDHEVPYHQAIARSPSNASIALLVDKAFRFTLATPPGSPSSISSRRTLAGPVSAITSAELHQTDAEIAEPIPSNTLGVVHIEGFEYFARHERHYWATSRSYRSLTRKLSQLDGLNVPNTEGKGEEENDEDIGCDDNRNEWRSSELTSTIEISPFTY